MADDCDNIDKIYDMSKFLTCSEIKLCAWNQNEEMDLLALYVGNGDIVFCCFTEEEPIIKQVPWFSNRDHNPVSLCFNPSVKCDQLFDVNDLTLITYPFPTKAPKQIKVKMKSPNSSLSIKSNLSSHSSSPSTSSSDTWKGINSSSSYSNTMETRTNENLMKLKDIKSVKTELKPVAVTWWQDNNGCIPTAIIGTLLGEIIFVDLYNGTKVRNSTVNGPIKSLSVCHDSNFENAFLLITLENNTQYKLTLEQKDMLGGNKDYQSSLEDNDNGGDDGQYGKNFYLPAARSRLQGLKQLSVEKIATIKQKIAESRFKTALKEETPEEFNQKPCNSEPEYVWGKVSDIVIMPQIALDQFLLASYHPTTQLLSIHTMALNAIPLCTYRLPVDVEQVLLCDCVIFTVSTSRNVIQVISRRVSEVKNSCWEFDADCILGKWDLREMADDGKVVKDATPKVDPLKPDLIPRDTDFENNEKILGIYKRRWSREPLDCLEEYNLSDYKIDELVNFMKIENCIVVTNKSVYFVKRRWSVIKMALNWILKTKELEKVEKLCTIFQLNLGVLLQLAGDIKLASGDLSQAIAFYRMSKCGLLKIAVKLSAGGHCDHFLKFSVPLMSDSSFSDMTITERIHFSNLVLMAYTQQILSSDNNCELTKTFLQFLENNSYYDGILAVSVTGQSFLFKCLHKLMIHKGLILDSYNVLIKLIQRFLDNKSLQWTINKNDFWTCLTENCLIEAMIYKTSTLPIYAEYVIQNVESFDMVHLNRLLTLTDPTSPYVRSVARTTKALNDSLVDNDDIENSFPFQKLVELFLITLLVKINKAKDVNGYNRSLLLPSTDLPRKMDWQSSDSQEESFEAVDNSTEHIWAIRKDLKESEILRRKRESVLSCGFGHAALIRNGSVYTWGQTVKGCLGHGPTMSKQSPPQPITWLSALRLEVTIVSCGKQHTVALTNNGLYAWGCSAYGQLGLGHVYESPHPRLVSALANENLISVRCGHYHTLALTNQGSVFAWGWGVHGQLGLGTIEDERLPKVIDTLKEQVIVDIAAGHGHSLVLSDKGHVYSFGSSVCGQLGTGNVVKSSTPILVKGINGRVTTIATGYFHNLAVTESNVLYTWGISPLSLRRRRQRMMEKNNVQSPNSDADNATEGSNNVDEGGGEDIPEASCTTEKNETHLSPTVVDTEDVVGKIVQVCCGCHYSLLITDSGSVYTWGRSVNQMGNVNLREILKPTLFTFNDVRVDAASCGSEFTAVQDKQTGKIFSWGSNSVGQLGVPVEESPARCLDGKVIMLKSCKRTIRIPTSLTGNFMSPREVPDIPPSSFTYQTLYRPSSADSFDLSRTDPEGYFVRCLHLAIEKYRQVYNVNVILKKCLELGNYQAASKIAILENKLKQSMIYQLKGLQSIPKYHPKTLMSFEKRDMMREDIKSPRSEVATPESEIHLFADQGGNEELCEDEHSRDVSSSEDDGNSRREMEQTTMTADGMKCSTACDDCLDENYQSRLKEEYVEHAKFILDTYIGLCLKQLGSETSLHSVLETGIQFWTAEKLPLVALEDFLMEKMDLLYYDLGYLLFCQLKRDNQGSILQQFSSSFLLEMTSKLLTHIEGNGSCPEYVDTMSKMVLNDKADLATVRGHNGGRKKRNNRKPEVFIQIIAEKLLKKTSPMTNGSSDHFMLVPPCHILGEYIYYFSCGHRHSFKSLEDGLKLFERIRDTGIRDRILKFYRMIDTNKSADISCPSCVYNYMKQ